MPFPFGPSLPGQGDIELSKVPTRNPFIYTIQFGLFDDATGKLLEESVVRIGFDKPVSGNEAIRRFSELYEDTSEGSLSERSGIPDLVVANAFVAGPVLESR